MMELFGEMKNVPSLTILYLFHSMLCAAKLRILEVKYISGDWVPWEKLYIGSFEARLAQFFIQGMFYCLVLCGLFIGGW